MSKFLDVVNNTASTVMLKCTRTHIVTPPHGGIYSSVTYKKDQIVSRNLIMLNIANWKIAPKKYQRDYQKAIYVKNKQSCSNVTKTKSSMDERFNGGSNKETRKSSVIFY